MTTQTNLELYTEHLLGMLKKVSSLVAELLFFALLKKSTLKNILTKKNGAQASLNVRAKSLSVKSLATLVLMALSLSIAY